MTCDDFARCLHPYIDGELDAAALVAAEDHVSHCSSCAAKVAHYRQLGAQVRAASKEVVPASLARRAQELRGSAAAGNSRRHPRVWVMTAVAALVLAGIGLLWATSAERLDRDDVHEVAELQHRSELPGHLVDLETSDTGQLVPWLSKKVPFTPWTGRMRSDYTLVGARLDYCDDQVVAVVVLRYQQHIVNVVSYPSDTPRERLPATARSQEVSLCGWSHGGIQVFVASDLPVTEVERIAAWLRG